MITAKQFYIQWFLPGMKPMDFWTLNMMNGKQELVFRCRQNHELWKPFDIHNGYFNWCAVAMTRQECVLVCHLLYKLRRGPLPEPDFIRALSGMTLNGEHKVILFLKMMDWENGSIADAMYTSPDNVKKVLSRCAEEYGYSGTPALINALKMRLWR